MTKQTDYPWQIGLAEVCTTPDPPVWLYGYACPRRHRPFEGKLHDVYAKAMALEDAHGYRAVLITADLCVLRAREAAQLFACLQERTGLTEDRLLVNLSHTHSGPMIGVPNAEMYPMSTEERERSLAYTAELFERIADAAYRALEDLRPARLSMGIGRVGFTRSRRLFDEQGNYKGMGPNPDLYADPRVPVLRVDTVDGRLRALAFGLSCHAVTLGSENLMLSGDFPGFAQQNIQADCPGVQAMFVQGCGADVNSCPRATPDHVEQARKHGECLAAEVLRVAGGTDLRPISGPLCTEHAWVKLPLRRLSREQIEQMSGGPMWDAHNAKRILAFMNAGQDPPQEYSAPFAAWQFGQDLTLVALCGETTCGYIPAVEATLGRQRLWVTGYSNQVFGYLPTAQIVEQGGYERVGLVQDIGLFAHDTEKVVTQKVRELALKAGRGAAG